MEFQAYFMGGLKIRALLVSTMGLFAFNNDYAKRWEGKKDEQPVMPTKPEFDPPEYEQPPQKNMPKAAAGSRRPPRQRRKPVQKRAKE